MIDRIYKRTPVRNTIRRVGERNDLPRLASAARLSSVIAIKRRKFLIREVKTGRIDGWPLKGLTDHQYDQVIDVLIDRIKEVEL